MEYYCLERRPPPLMAPRRGSNPSFSSTLLDTIYRSLDENSPELEKFSLKHQKPKHTRTEMLVPQNEPPSEFWWVSSKRKQPTPSYSTSSDSSSSYGFSSDTEPPRMSTKPMKVNRVKFDTTALPSKTPPHDEKIKKKKSNLFRNRWRELRKGSRICTSAAGTGTRNNSSPLSNFLKAIFSSTQKKKNNTSDTTTTPQQGIAMPVHVPEPLLPPEERGTVDVDMEAEDLQRRVEEILRGLPHKKTEGEEDEESDGSSDLFELENLTDIGSDELPVYCTTSMVANHPPPPLPLVGTT